MTRLYFDYAATSPVDPAVAAAMKPYFSEKFGNPGSLHFFGQQAMAAVDQAREKIAKAVNADFREIIFTGSATEANNLALRGVVKKFKIQNSKFEIPRIIVSAIEHESILETARDLAASFQEASLAPLGREDVEVIYLPVDKKGLVDLAKLKKSLNERTILVSVMYVNNEIGTIQPITEISKIIKEFKETILFHTDAVQAFQYLDCDVGKLGVDLMTLSGHKICGPKGIGALYVRSQNSKPHTLNPIITGGGQEFGLRSGTENVALIAGLAKAMELAAKKRKEEKRRMVELKNFFWRELKKVFLKAEVNGGEPALPNILNIWFPSQTASELLIKLDLAGIAVSAGSACSARATKDSHVLKALGLPIKCVRESLRFSFGRFTTREEIKEAIKRIKNIF